MTSFSFLSQGQEQASKGSDDIPTRLAPRGTPILCRQTQWILLKKREKKYARGRLGQNPQNKKQ